MRQDFLPFSLPTIGKEEITEAADSLKSGWSTTDCASIYSFSPGKYAFASAPAYVALLAAFVRTAWRAYIWRRMSGSSD